MTAEELMKRYSLSEHIENGSFVERHYASYAKRADSGSIYYYVSPLERTKFHSIDCDEYWVYNAGSPLEVWMVGEDGSLSVEKLGLEEGCEPLLYVKKGLLFASRHGQRETEGTFLTCITVPRFQYEGFVLVEDDEMKARYPETIPFFENAAESGEIQ